MHYDVKLQFRSANVYRSFKKLEDAQAYCDSIRKEGKYPIQLRCFEHSFDSKPVAVVQIRK